MLEIPPLAPRLEPRSAIDGFGDELETEWTLVDPQNESPVVMLVALNEEGEALARKLALAYNNHDALISTLSMLMWVCQSCDIYPKVKTPFEEAREAINRVSHESEVPHA